MINEILTIQKLITDILSFILAFNNANLLKLAY